MFEQVGHGSKSGTKQLLRMLPGLRADEDGGADFRLLLHQRHQAAQGRHAGQSPALRLLSAQLHRQVALPAASAKKPAVQVP